MPRGFRVHAARYKLDLVPSEELKSIANAALEDGIYSESLAQLAVTSNPVMSECGPLFEAALRELEVPVPDESEAVWIALRHRMAQIAVGRVAPREGMRRIVDEIVHKANLHDQAKEYLGDSHGIEKLLGAFYGYDDLEERPEEVSCLGKKGKQAIEALDEQVVMLAHEWISTHGIDPDEPPRNGVSRKDAEGQPE